ncbi:PLP-dependent aminotransferase family protein [Burkholderia stagnalis]|uniref:aminotransferase-like domain-containing protein n=1 Tax=Burkholderia stagnalis TaxID=1503054 RepID=UPI00075D7105|nr:PLP-dependent aminotransferase family protein [Burkholderia stagnalis]KVC55977.1 GntR family transcriptional regulator [Burkholderia stagnalis]KVN12105.1 GntR family transcriptional regulator [Burkholderia stagnalis]KWI75360.1 GntR family transcriptional regulator [Burkholderia stagnalis]KWK62786.1 GntR family transcriptional regulator [Burkholderia stagnalis]KWN24685.1 GntR family transcriptional regulator [Burkholderia stagnalis]
MREPRYKPLVDRLAADIRAGRLLPGTRLPTHRDLAEREGLALVTATRVYAELGAMGLVSGETGRGTFVKEPLPLGQGIDLHAWGADTVDLSFNYPSSPDQAELFRAALRQLAARGDLESLLRYQPHGGRDHERAAAARHLSGRGLKAATAETVLLVSGAQHGLTTTAMALLEPGDVVAVDALTYPGFKLAAEANRLELAPIPAAGRGPDLDALAALCRRRRVRAVYAMPTLHNPLGWVTGAARRRELVAIARRHGLLIIEDAAYAFLAEHAPPPLASLAPETTVYVSSLSKSVATGLRVGFVHAPREWIPKIERKIRATTWNTPATMTAIACGWIDDGTVALLEAEKRRDAALRQDIAARMLHGLKRVGHPASYFLWLPLAPEVRSDAVAMALQRERISVSTAHPYATSPQVPHAIRLALGSVSLPTLEQSLETVARVIADHSF